LNAEASLKYGQDSITWPTTVDAQLLSQVSGGPSKDGRLYGMPMYMDPEEQGVSYRKYPRHTIPSNSVQSSQQVVQLQQTVTALHENQQTLEEKFERMESAFYDAGRDARRDVGMDARRRRG
ncbi:hypothetical protein SLEP1_g60509, partial [Rubroshorea leprosula]